MRHTVRRYGSESTNFDHFAVSLCFRWEKSKYETPGPGTYAEPNQFALREEIPERLQCFGSTAIRLNEFDSSIGVASVVDGDRAADLPIREAPFLEPGFV